MCSEHQEWGRTPRIAKSVRNVDLMNVFFLVLLKRD